MSVFQTPSTMNCSKYYTKNISSFNIQQSLRYINKHYNKTTAIGNTRVLIKLLHNLVGISQIIKQTYFPEIKSNYSNNYSRRQPLTLFIRTDLNNIKISNKSHDHWSG